ncbi:single-stranded DNA-binding protein [Niallia taxi]|uniref:single-stranded DNA-binding protein n=1 Tax=Niallia taxi TaxID=2499688 RepID=UPI0015F54BD0|nr:single-stranded DNA-binding protein [Niallia taxi]
MASYNKSEFIGRLTADPELRYTPSGVAVATFTLAVDRKFQNQQGQKETDFVDHVVWRGQAETVANYLGKGDMVMTVARYQKRPYENQEGKKVYAHEFVCDEVVFLETKKNRAQGGQQGQGGAQGGQQRQGGTQGGQQRANNQRNQQSNQNHYEDPFAGGTPVDIGDDDLPF